MGESGRIRTPHALSCGALCLNMSPSASEADAEPRRRCAAMLQKMTDRVLICLPDGRWLASAA